MDQTTTEIYGNLDAQRRVSQLTDPRHSMRAVALTGQSYLGKRTFLEQRIAATLSEEDVLIPEAAIDGVREAREFLTSHPLYSPFKAVIIDGADRMMEGAQDALLKILEEPTAGGRIFLVVEDEGLLQVAVQSRLNEVVRWSPLKETEMREFAATTRVDDDALRLCQGRPGLYSIFLGETKYLEFQRLCVRLISGKEDPVMCRTPELVSSLKSGRSIERDALCHVIVNATAELRALPALSGNVRGFMRLASDLLKVPSANADIHWQRACLKLSGRAV